MVLGKDGALQLSFDEKRVLGALKSLKEASLSELVSKTGLGQDNIFRAALWLSNKGFVKREERKKEFVSLGEEGKKYQKDGLPERQVINFLLEEKVPVEIFRLNKELKLEDGAMKYSIGLLKRKGLIDIVKGRLVLKSNLILYKSKELGLESVFNKVAKSGEIEVSDLVEEEQKICKELVNRGGILKIKESSNPVFEITKEGLWAKISDVDLVGGLSGEMIRSGSFRNKEFRHFDVLAKTPKIFGGRRHIMAQAIDYVRRVWISMGFSEMRGEILQTSFWNFDALFTPQDHPAREMQDTFFVKEPKFGELPEDRRLVNGVKEMHESGGKIGSAGWRYKFLEEESKKNVLRTHTTCVSAQTLYKISKQRKYPYRFFSVGRVFRNEALDWKHLFEFYQSEGIVIDPDANFGQLLSYLKEFFLKLGFNKVRFRPGYFPYTEMSVEPEVYDEEKGEWVEFGGAGIFRPEVVVPLLGEDVPVLAWGLGFERSAAKAYEIKDIRELYNNDLGRLRRAKVWEK